MKFLFFFSLWPLFYSHYCWQKAVQSRLRLCTAFCRVFRLLNQFQWFVLCISPSRSVECGLLRSYSLTHRCRMYLYGGGRLAADFCPCSVFTACHRKWEAMGGNTSVLLSGLGLTGPRTLKNNQLYRTESELFLPNKTSYWMPTFSS